MELPHQFQASDEASENSSEVLSVLPTNKDLDLSDRGGETDADCDNNSNNNNNSDLPVDRAKEELNGLVYQENQAVVRWRKIAVALLATTAVFITTTTFTSVRTDDYQTFATTVS
jgi:hypothetical protein